MLKLLTNHSRLVLDMQIILPPRELQVDVAKDNSILPDELVVDSEKPSGLRLLTKWLIQIVFNFLPNRAITFRVEPRPFKLTSTLKIGA